MITSACGSDRISRDLSSLRRDSECRAGPAGNFRHHRGHDHRRHRRPRPAGHDRRHPRRPYRRYRARLRRRGRRRRAQDLRPRQVPHSGPVGHARAPELVEGERAAGARGQRHHRGARHGRVSAGDRRLADADLGGNSPRPANPARGTDPERTEVQRLSDDPGQPRRNERSRAGLEGGRRRLPEGPPPPSPRLLFRADRRGKASRPLRRRPHPHHGDRRKRHRMRARRPWSTRRHCSRGPSPPV
jgi:hypothetical protein